MSNEKIPLVKDPNLCDAHEIIDRMLANIKKTIDEMDDVEYEIDQEAKQPRISRDYMLYRPLPIMGWDKNKTRPKLDAGDLFMRWAILMAMLVIACRFLFGT